MKAIIVSYKGPTNTRSSRLMAKTDGYKALSEPIDYGMSIDDQAGQLARRYYEDVLIHWRKGGKLYGAALKNGDGVFVVVHKDTEAF